MIRWVVSDRPLDLLQSSVGSFLMIHWVVSNQPLHLFWYPLDLFGLSCGFFFGLSNMSIPVIRSIYSGRPLGLFRSFIGPVLVCWVCGDALLTVLPYVPWPCPATYISLHFEPWSVWIATLKIHIQASTRWLFCLPTVSKVYHKNIRFLQVLVVYFCVWKTFYVYETSVWTRNCAETTRMELSLKTSALVLKVKIPFILPSRDSQHGNAKARSS